MHKSKTFSFLFLMKETIIQCKYFYILFSLDYIFSLGICVLPHYFFNLYQFFPFKINMVLHLVLHLPPPSLIVHLAVIGYLAYTEVQIQGLLLMKQQLSRWDFSCSHHLLQGKTCSSVSS